MSTYYKTPFVYVTYILFVDLIICKMKIFRFALVPKQICNFKGLTAAFGTLQQEKMRLFCIRTSFDNQRKRSFSFFAFKDLLRWTSSWLPINITINWQWFLFNWIKGDKTKMENVHMFTSHLCHKEVTRKRLLSSLQELEKSPISSTEVVYIVGLPGTGKKELTRQYAKDYYDMHTKGRKDRSNVFVAMINASNPEKFHQDLLKISEKIGIADYSTKAEKVDGYNKILLEITTYLDKKANWLLVLNDIKLNLNLQWLIGERYIKKQSKECDLDLSNPLPSPGDPSNGTILITTCDSYAYMHEGSNVTCFDMPVRMENDEALQLLEIGSKINNLYKSESAKKVVSVLEHAPISVYW